MTPAGLLPSAGAERRACRGGRSRSRSSARSSSSASSAGSSSTPPAGPRSRQAFLERAESSGSRCPSLVAAFWKNIQLFLIAEVLILAFGAAARGHARPARARSSSRSGSWRRSTSDVFRAIPGIVVIYVLGFGIPGLGIPAIPDDRVLLGGHRA